MNIREPLPEELPGSSQLMKMALVAILIAVALTISIILPAERGIDITGIGTTLGLTPMGQLKTALAEEDASQEGRPQQKNETAIAVFPGHGKEIKMEMSKGFSADYSWTSTGPLYHDTHGDVYANSDVYLSYSIEESVSSDSGNITALYGGFHGWYWKNNTNMIITVKLTTEGEYFNIGPRH